MTNRFHDQNLRITDFQQEVDVVCPKCQKKALATVNYEDKQAKLICKHCGYIDIKESAVTFLGVHDYFRTAAHVYFDAELWYLTPFKNDVFFAYNDAHLNYLEQYIGAKLREHKDRSHFTFLEKLPKFYHEAKNRNTLLKLISKLRNK